MSFLTTHKKWVIFFSHVGGGGGGHLISDLYFGVSQFVLFQTEGVRSCAQVHPL